MNKLSLFVAIATLSLAAPALAQTPSDIRNGRGTVAAEPSPEVKLDRQGGNAMSSDTMETSKGSGEHHGKKHHKHAGAKHHGKKHHGKKHDADKGAAEKGAAKEEGSK